VSAVSRAIKSFIQAVKAAVGSAPLVALVVLGLAGLLAGSEKAIYAWVAGQGLTGQSAMVPLILGWGGLGLAIELLVGPFVAGTAVFVALRAAGGTRHPPMAGLSYAAKRYGRMFVPHLKAQLLIQIGSQLFLPGLLAWSMYAFSDAVAALEGDPAPLARSARLTQGRRATLVWLVLPFMVVGTVKAFLFDFDFVQSQSLPVFVAWMAPWVLWSYLLLLAQAFLYLDRIGGIEALQQAAQQRGAGAEPAGPAA
jgi:hypothetical protein